MRPAIPRCRASAGIPRSSFGLPDFF